MKRERDGSVSEVRDMTQRARFDSYDHGLPEESFGYYTVAIDETEGYHVFFQPYFEAVERSPAEQEGNALDQQLIQAEHGGDEQALQELKRRIAADQDLAAQDPDAYRRARVIDLES